MIEKIERSTLAILLAFAAGVFVYVGATHLLLAVERENKRFSIEALVAGILTAVVIALSKG